jgi:hypothetical protein
MGAGIVVNVMPEDCRRLEAIVSDRNASQKHVWRAKIILATADGCGTDEIMRRSGKAKPVVWRWQARFMAEGVAGLTRDKTRKPGKPPLPCGHRAGANPEIEGAEHERGEERAIGVARRSTPTTMVSRPSLCGARGRARGRPARVRSREQDLRSARKARTIRLSPAP